MKTLKVLIILLMITSAYGAGVLMGWDAGVRDERNLETVQTP
jgi:hypothetical protein